VVPLDDGSVGEPEPTVPEADPARATSAPASHPELGLAEEAAPEEPRRYPSTVGGAFYLLVLGVTVVALVVVGLGHWRGGVHVLAGSVVAAALVRAVLPDRDAGMLEVRSRWLDVALLVAVGAVMWILATTIPAQG
jgi:hypothetical protein